MSPKTSPKILCLSLSPAMQRTLRLDPLKRGQVNRIAQVTLSAAGKGVNAARVVKTLGGQPAQLGLLGGHSGRQLKNLLKQEGLPGTWISFEGETRHAHTLLEDEEVTELVEENPPPGKQVYDEVLEVFEKMVRRCDAVILAGSPPPCAPANLYRKLVEVSGAKPFLMDAQKKQFTNALKSKPAFVKCNRDELACTMGVTIRSQAAMLKAMKGLMKRGAQNILVTDGAKPALLLTASGAWKLTPPKIEAINTIGSGDATNAGIMVARLRGANWVEACGYGMACGAANALTEKPGFLHMAAVKKISQHVAIAVLGLGEETSPEISSGNRTDGPAKRP